MASLTRWTWVWASSRSWWWTGKSGMLQSMGSQSQTRLSNWTELNNCWLQYLSNEYILRCNSSLNDWSLFSWNTLNQKILFLFEKESIRFFLYATLVEEERRCFYVPVRTFPQLPPSPSYLNYIMIQVEKADKTKLGNQFWLLPLKCLLVTRRINALTMQMFLIYCSAFRYPDTGDSYQHHRRYRPSLQRQQRMRWLDGITNWMGMSPSQGLGDGQGSLACYSPWCLRVRHDWATELNWISALPLSLGAC